MNSADRRLDVVLGLCVVAIALAMLAGDWEFAASMCVCWIVGYSLGRWG